MSHEITFESIVDEFRNTYPTMGACIVDSYPSGPLEITVKLSDGTKWFYDYVSKAIQYLGNINESGDIHIEEYISEEDHRDIVSVRLRKKMRLRGLSQEELARLAKVSTRSLSNYMNGRSTPSTYVIIKLARALDCSVSELIYCG